jgi:hypothetical protein
MDFRNESDVELFNNDNHTNSTTGRDHSDNTLVFIEMVSLFYFVGIVGSFLAMLHLYRKRNFKNTKQALMLR